MKTVLDVVKSPGIACIDCPQGRFQYELSNLWSPDALVKPVLDLAPPLYDPGSKGIIFDRSGKNNHGTITGATWKQNSIGQWYLDFDGLTNIVKCTSYFGDINFKNQAFTIKQWINPDSADGWRNIINIKPTTAANFGVQVQRTSTNVLNVVFLRADSDITGRVMMSGAATINASKWSLVEITYDGTGTPSATTVFAYVNGVAVTLGAGAGSENFPADNNVVLIGGCQATYFWDGDLALTKVYNAVSPSTFQQEKSLMGV